MTRKPKYSLAQKRAAQLFRDFREKPATRIKSVRVSIPKAVAVLGFCDEIFYSTTHGNRAVRYKHKFHKGSRPLLCAGPERGQLYLLQGNFRVTERGIVDTSPRGREIE